jgi:hypothetical protein
MSASGLWETLRKGMDSVAQFVDSLNVVLLWFCLVAIPVCLVVWLVRAVIHAECQGTDAGDATPYRPSWLRSRLDQMANITVSRRPQTRKRHHRHRHHAETGAGVNQ